MNSPTGRRPRRVRHRLHVHRPLQVREQPRQRGAGGPGLRGLLRDRFALRATVRPNPRDHTRPRRLRQHRVTHEQRRTFCGVGAQQNAAVDVVDRVLRHRPGDDLRHLAGLVERDRLTRPPRHIARVIVRVRTGPHSSRAGHGVHRVRTIPARRRVSVRSGRGRPHRRALHESRAVTGGVVIRVLMPIRLEPAHPTRRWSRVARSRRVRRPGPRQLPQRVIRIAGLLRALRRQYGAHRRRCHVAHRITRVRTVSDVMTHATEHRVVLDRQHRAGCGVVPIGRVRTARRSVETVELRKLSDGRIHRVREDAGRAAHAAQLSPGVIAVADRLRRQPAHRGHLLHPQRRIRVVVESRLVARPGECGCACGDRQRRLQRVSCGIVRRHS